MVGHGAGVRGPVVVQRDAVADGAELHHRGFGLDGQLALRDDFVFGLRTGRDEWQTQSTKEHTSPKNVYVEGHMKALNFSFAKQKVPLGGKMRRLSLWPCFFFHSFVSKERERT